MKRLFLTFNWDVLRFRFLLSLLVGLALFFGCLGGGGSLGVRPVDTTGGNAPVSGRVFYPDQLLFGGIPILVRDALTGAPVAATVTGKNGDFFVSPLPDGVYNLFASSGNAETQFASAVSVSGQRPQVLSEVELLGLKSVAIDGISSTSARLTFDSNRPAVSFYSHSPSPNRNPVSASPVTNHQVTLTGLAPLVLYELTVFLTGVDGQFFVYPGLVFTTTNGSGPSGLSLVINDGAYSTRVNTVNATLRAKSATQVKVAQEEAFAATGFESFTNPMIRTLTLTGADGTKKVLAQFRDGQGNLSPVLSASILQRTNTTGLLGVWIEKGASVIYSPSVTLTIAYPGATSMQLSETVDFANTFWESFANVRRWTTSSSLGTKSVYARFRGNDVDSSLVFSASTLLQAPSTSPTTTTASGTVASGTSSATASVPVVVPPIDDTGTFTVTLLDAPVGAPVIAATITLEIDTLRVYGFVQNSKQDATYTRSLKWYVNGVEGGNDDLGRLTTDGTAYSASPNIVYKAPLKMPSTGNEITLRAEYGYTYSSGTGASTQETALAEVRISLVNFWQPQRVQLLDSTGDFMPIYSLLVDPIWQPGENYWLFAGTNGYGIWFSQITPDLLGNGSNYVWQASSLATTQFLASDSSFVVNKLDINSANGDIVAATEGGVYILGIGSRGGRDYTQAPVKIRDGSTKSVVWDKRDTSYIYITRSFGIERLQVDYGGGAPAVVASESWYLSVPYRIRETRTASVGSPPADVAVEAWSYAYTAPPFDPPPRTLGLSPSDPQALYFGNDSGQVGLILNSRNYSSKVQPYINQNTFVTGRTNDITSPPRSSFGLSNGLIIEAPRSTVSGIITDFSVDPNSPWTLLMSTSTGVSRSIDRGAGWSTLRGNVNSRGTLIDSTNVTFFFFGAEDGLYRSKDAGAAWQQTSSGLENVLPINCFTQSPGAPGKDRRIWVGTTGGVFSAAKSLDLY